MESESPLSLRFDKAQLDQPTGSLTCSYCQRDVTGSYYEINGQTACETCRGQAEQARARRFSIGKGLRALLGGGAGGLVGALLYYGVSALTGYEIGLVAIVVGLLVGFGVRWGSGGVGGRGYQILAVAITYVSIVSTYVPFIIEEIRKQGAAEETAAAQPDQPAMSEGGERASRAQPAPSGTVDPEASPDPPPSVGMMVVYLGLFALFILASPFLAGVQNVIGWLIIGFALFEAWKVNRAATIVIEGPFQVGANPSSTTA